jgi:hypothetical protein
MWSCGNYIERDEDDEIKWTTDELVNMVDNKYTFGNKTFRQFLKYMYNN